MKAQRNVVFIFGPMAVGKMTVGQALQQKINFDLLQNHSSIEFTLDYYDYDTAGFGTINEGIRKLVFNTIAKDPNKFGFIFTCVWAFDQVSDWAYIKKIDNLFVEQGWTTRYVELTSSLEIRLARNRSPHRLQHKPSKNDVEASERILLSMTRENRFHSLPGEIGEKHYLKIDNEKMSPNEVADEIINSFHLTPI